MDKTMKDETPNAFDKMLMLFVSKDRLRPTITLPMKYGEYIYATNNYIIVRIKSDMTNVEYCHLTDQAHEKLPIDKHFKNITPNSNFRISIYSLENALRNITKVDEEIEGDEYEECDECDGRGEVEWEYKEYTKYFDCPVCDGTGLSEEKKRVKTGNKVYNPESVIKIGNAAFRAYLIGIIVEAMKLTGENHLLYDFQSINSKNRFILNNSGIEIILMPIIDKIPDYTIKLTGKNQI